ncbi:hypothetical protein Tco_0882698 [Tanacetum coccineum]
MQSWGRSSYARAMIDLRADEELKDSIMVDMPKLVSEGFNMCTVRVVYEWKLPSKLRYNANEIWDGLALDSMMRNFKCTAMMRTICVMMQFELS